MRGKNNFKIEICAEFLTENFGIEKNCRKNLTIEKFFDKIMRLFY